MKKILIPLLLSSIVLSANNIDLSWVDEQVDAIKPARDGESIRNISRIKDPFIFLKKNSTKKDEKQTSTKKPAVIQKSTKDSVSKKVAVFTKNSFSLGAIINNSALINEKWYSVGDTINGYKIISIGKKTVGLRSGSKSKLLTTATKNTKLKFKNR